MLLLISCVEFAYDVLRKGKSRAVKIQRVGYLNEV